MTGGKSTGEKGDIFIAIAIIIAVAATGASLVALFVFQNNNQLEIHHLQSKMEAMRREFHLRYKEQAYFRRKRQVEDTSRGDVETAGKSGVHVFDYAYGVDLNSMSKLSVYPSLMQGNHDQQVDGLSQRPVSQNLVSNSKSSQSSYARRVNAHRKSRVSNTASSVPSTAASSLPVKKAFKKPVVRSLETPSRIFDSVATPLLSVHLQAKVSLDESSSDLTSGVHTAWRLSRWSRRLHGATLFIINETNGTIVIPEDGLYIVYAQVEYMDTHDVNGFEVNVDNEATLSCVTTTHDKDSKPEKKKKKKHNTCHTSAVFYLQRGTNVVVRDKEAGRYSLLHSKGTFFGLTRISPL